MRIELGLDWLSLRIGRLLSKISWHNYIIPNRYWRLVKGKDFIGTYMGIPLYKSPYLEEEESKK